MDAASVPLERLVKVLLDLCGGAFRLGAWKVRHHDDGEIRPRIDERLGEVHAIRPIVG